MEGKEITMYRHEKETTIFYQKLKVYMGVDDHLQAAGGDGEDELDQDEEGKVDAQANEGVDR